MRLLPKGLVCAVTFVGLVLGYGIPALGSAANIYIAQSAAGAANGADCNDAYAYTFFNTAKNWGSGASQIGPGTTVHLCGTFTFTAGTAGLTAQGSGASGNPITIHFESGAILQSPYFLNGGANAGGAINLAANQVSYITINGGGTGIIQNTNNGTAGSYTYQNATLGIEASCTANVTIQNLTIQNMYVRTSTTDSSIDQTGLNSIHATDNGCTNHLTNLTINNVTMHDAGWHLAIYGTNTIIENCNIYNMDHGIASGLGSTGYSGLYVVGNHFHDMAVWDDTSGSDAYHHDGIHLWGTSGSGGWTNVYIYNNQFDGNAGTPNAWIYFEYVVGPSYMFNNTFTSSPGSSFPSEFGPFGGTTTQFLANNTLYDYSATSCANSGSIGLVTRSTGVTAKNNIVAGQYTSMILGAGYSLASGGIDYNVYGNTYAACGASSNTFSIGGVYDGNTLAGWQAALPAGNGQDLHAKQATTNSQLGINSNMTLASGSIAIGAGTNLYSTCNGQPNPGLGALCYDKNGVARPASGAWDAGAYVYAAAAPPAAPTNPSAMSH